MGRRRTNGRDRPDGSGSLPPIDVLRARLGAFEPPEPGPWLHPVLRVATRPAAVVATLFPRQGRWRLLFVEKRGDLRKHAGDVAFPGGAARADDEAPWDTATREWQEETGLQAGEELERIGRLSTIPTMTGYIVRPYVAVMARDPGPIAPGDPGEVARIFSEDAEWFLDPASAALTILRWEGCPFPSWRHPTTGVRIWGATGMMVNELLRIWTGQDTVEVAARRTA